MCCTRVFLFDNSFADPPPAVNFTAVQSFNETVISWTGSPDGSCPITNYTITINGSYVTVVAGNYSQYTHPAVVECESTLEISMFATNAVGHGGTTGTSLTIVPEGEFCMAVGARTPLNERS